MPAPTSFLHAYHDIPPLDMRRDPRVEAVRTFFEKTDCPARDYAEAFLFAADYNHLDWRLLPSLSFVESTGGKLASNNNFFGWNSGQADFETPEAGIHAVGYQLAHSSLYRHKNLDALLATYNPNAEYGAKVKSVMRQIAPNQ